MTGKSYPPEYIVLTKRSAKRFQKFESLEEAVILVNNNKKKYGGASIYNLAALMHEYKDMVRHDNA